jgi:hypothetical protein
MDLKLNKAEHRGSYFKIINHQYPDNFVRKYIIQSLENKQIKNVFIHEIYTSTLIPNRFHDVHTYNTRPQALV